MKLRRWMILSLALALAGAVMAGLGASVRAADWPQLQADAERSGYSPDAVRAPFKLKWAWFGDATRYPGQPAPARATARIGGLVQPVVVGDLVYVGAMDGTLYAIDRQKGV
ncbi:MAG: PQQ-binding-like beta-propeller repeat protein, partial [Planctomycetes bacterium]|nr:PQQ-binding-like beta-propeller repeat protein [Planctomycetota bacterium]